MTFTDSRKGYHLNSITKTELNDDVYYLFFGMSSIQGSDKNNGSYAYPLTIIVYPKSVWTEVQKEGGPNGTYIAENNNYVFAYSQWQDIPDNLMGVNFQVPKVISSFTLTK